MYLEMGKKMSKYRYELIIIVITVFMGSVILGNLGCSGFWTDDLFTVGAVRIGNSLADIVHLFLTSEVTNPPFYDFVEYFWYRIAPHTEFWQLIPNVVFYCAGVAVLGRIVWRLIGRKYAITMLIGLMISSTYAAKYMLNVLRSYALMFLLMSVVLYFWIKVDENPIKRNIFLHGIAMTFLSFTHYFGPIAVAGIGVVDAARYILGSCGKNSVSRIPLKRAAAYLMVAFTLGPWLVLAMINRTRSVAEFWPDKPSVMLVIQIILSLIGTKFVAAVFIVPVLVYVLNLFRHILVKRESLDIKERFSALCIWDVCFVIGIVFVYSRWINPQGGIFVDHYFVSVMPQMAMVLVISADYFIKLLEKSNVNGFVRRNCAFFFVLLVLIVAVGDGYAHMSSLFTRAPRQRLAAEYVSDCIGQDDGMRTAIYTPDYIREGEATAAATRMARIGYKEFYLSGIDMTERGYLDDQSDFSGYDRVYVCYCVFYDANLYIAYDYADQMLTDAGYVLINDNTDACVRIYDKI